MYNPPAFREERPEALRAMLESARLALLVSNGAEGVPEASHLPLVLAPEEGPHGTLYGHLARANPHWRGLAAAGRALAVFAGPEAYVSPSFYPSKAEHGRVVPTWNYVAVHARGPVEVFDDPARLRRVVERLTERHEAGRAAPWAVSDAPEEFVRAQLRGIVGVALRIESLAGKRKLSQNRSEADRAGVVAGLAASADPRDRALAEAMRGAGAAGAP
ncbi:FMN-binding negative transcriptional regulator [Caldovatus aquaticus]|uniref:FMN-binding negative transcriptional regulator n=1 Tax=Caldovatus aquaticus TaxID=2865671 RepID=A0ABS7F5Y9_9PROT|nr:FMN-binding negative transcriptional regulator [Caldovatus aquaticus]MBW8271031.1 FMN-binding negative transcriptional regulator [Caldovatus aquaticus]